MTDSVDDRAAPAQGGVSTLELFVDLVFVFTITQLTALLTHDPTWTSVLRVALLLGITWWMYGGYAWLTNAVDPTAAVSRLLLLCGAAGFLVMALAVPEAYGPAGWAFGAGYFLVNAVHSGLFWWAGGPGAATALRTVAPLNLASAILVLLAGLLLPVPARTVLWCVALALQIVTPYLTGIGGFTIRSGHFVERHGLIVIIALGESVVAIGVGLAGIGLTPRLVGYAMLGLALAFGLWWLYFGFTGAGGASNTEDRRAEQALDAFSAGRTRALVALRSYGYAHHPMLLGIVALAAGVKLTIGHAGEHAHVPAALLLGGGVALYLVADVWFRRILRFGVARYRLAGAVLALGTVPLGVAVNGGVQLIALVVVLGALIARERLASRGGPAGSAVPGSVP